MAAMTPPDCLKPPSYSRLIKKYISGNIDLAIMFVLIMNFTQLLVKLCTAVCNRGRMKMIDGNLNCKRPQDGAHLAILSS